MHKCLTLSDYQLWMCDQIKEHLNKQQTITETKFKSELVQEFKEREVINIALSEMLVRLDKYDPRMRRLT
ncbi:hypothetical protein [Bacillus massilinigeriensis]|uniref:hypothetical protein n=1 Tax=Bacillus mediterraneensis TaxID=1805474 RepID=UPI0008F82A43|nr:hypothetical protein [Bacillus mediterraneensis]